MTRSGPLALTAAWVAAFQGDIVSALRHADVAEQSGASTPLPDGTASIQAAAAILRSAVCTGSLSDAARQAERAIQLEPRESPWRPSAHLQLGTIRLIQGQLDTAEPELEQAAQLAAHGQPAVYASSVAYLAAIDLHRGMVDAAAGRARDVRRLIDDGGLDQFPPMAFPTAIVGYILARRHDPSSSDLLRRSLTLLDAIAFAFPPADAWIRTVIAEGLLKVGDDELARQTLAGARRLLTRYPMDGRLHEMVTRTEQLLDPARRLPDPLTPREQELLTMLVAVRSLSDIAEELVVSLNTVKTHVRSIYQKLGVNSRQDAIRRARELGLLAEGSGTTR